LSPIGSNLNAETPKVWLSSSRKPVARMNLLCGMIRNVTGGALTR